MLCQLPSLPAQVSASQPQVYPKSDQKLSHCLLLRLSIDTYMYLLYYMQLYIYVWRMLATSTHPSIQWWRSVIRSNSATPKASQAQKADKRIQAQKRADHKTNRNAQIGGGRSHDSTQPDPPNVHKLVAIGHVTQPGRNMADALTEYGDTCCVRCLRCQPKSVQANPKSTRSQTKNSISLFTTTYQYIYVLTIYMCVIMHIRMQDGGGRSCDQSQPHPLTPQYTGGGRSYGPTQPRPRHPKHKKQTSKDTNTKR